MAGPDDERDAALDATVPSAPSAPFSSSQRTISDRTQADEPIVRKGDRIGRYEVVDRLGSGTMGLVVQAIDPTLDRKVAIKLLRADATGSTIGRQRLMREAQAMAKLSHPNVVTVFEVGTQDDNIFIAMEYVAGSTLADWLRGKSQAEKIAAFVQAGHGLAAAHRAGIVHRDFKPANVLVDEDGRVRVADFGLATAPDGEPLTASGERAMENLSMTRTGAVLGTPAYMAPEQHMSHPADARADQFAFCVALYEALYGELPFSGEHYSAYVERVVEGRVNDPPKGTSVPAWIRKVLLRGLSVDPDGRYLSMTYLLDALGRDPAKVRRRAVLGGAGALALVALMIMTRREDRADACADADRPLSQLWSPSEHIAMAHSFAATGVAGANTAYERTTRLLDERARGLRSARREACLATARGEQSADLLDRKMLCIDQRASELAVLVSILSDRPDGKTISKAVEAAANLPPLAQCADRAALLATVPPPTSPMLRVQVATINAKLDRIDALFEAGRFQEAVALTQTTLRDAEATQYAPVRARALFYDARNLIEISELDAAVGKLQHAAELAAAAQDDVLAAKIWNNLYTLVGYRLHRLDEARAIDSIAAAAVMRAGDPKELRAAFENARGILAIARGDYAKALEHLAVAEQKYSELFGQNHPFVATTLANQELALEGLGRYEEARTAIDRAIAVRIEVQGPDHVDTAMAYARRGGLLDVVGKKAEALADFERALAIDRRIYGEDSTKAAGDYMSVGMLLMQLGRHDEALANQTRAIAIIERHPEDRSHLATALLNLGDTYREMGRFQDALTTYDRALELSNAVYGPKNETSATIETNKSFVYYNLGDHARATALLEHVLWVREELLGPDHPDVAKTLGSLSTEATVRGDHAEVVRLLDRAIPIVQKAKLPLANIMLFGRGAAAIKLRRFEKAIADFTQARDGFIANGEPSAAVRMWLADALWEVNKRTEARAEMTAALAELEAMADQVEPATLAEARAWLAAHR